MTKIDSEHRLADVQTIVVDTDDIITTMKRNNRDRNQSRSHVLRITAPFEGKHRATPHVDEHHTHYDPDITAPFHIPPEAFIAGHGHGGAHPNFENHYKFPSRHESRGRFYDHYDLRDKNGDRPSELTDEQQQLWDEWWDQELTVWKEQVQHNLKDQIRFEGHDTTTVDVQYE